MQIDKDGIAYRSYRHGEILRGKAALAAISTGWEVEPLTRGAAFSADVQVWHHGRLMLARCRGDGVYLDRAADHPADAFDRSVQLNLVYAGGITASQRGQRLSAGPGELLSLMPKDAFRSRTENGSEITFFYVPLDYLESRGVDTRRLASTVWEDGPKVDALREFVDRAFAVPADDDSGRNRAIERGLLELVVGLLEAYRGGFRQEDETALAMRRTVLDIIEMSYIDPAFGVETIVGQLAASRRYLYSIFEGREVSLSSMIRARRLDHAEELMKQEDSAEMPIRRIAALSGFRGVDQFTRAFKARHGMTPSEFRSRA